MDYRRTQLRKARKRRNNGVPYVVHPPTYPRRSEVDYRSPMNATRPTGRDTSEWAKYVRFAVERCGGNVSQLRHKSGVSRSSLYRWMNDDGTRVTIEKATQIAHAIGDDPRNAIRAAGSLLEDAVAQGPDLHGLDPNDEVVQNILSLDIDDEERDIMLEHRRKLLALRREQDLRELEMLTKRNTRP